MENVEELIEQMRHCDMIDGACLDCKFTNNCRLQSYEEIADAMTEMYYRLEGLKIFFGGVT